MKLTNLRMFKKSYGTIQRAILRQLTATLKRDDQVEKRETQVSNRYTKIETILNRYK